MAKTVEICNNPGSRICHIFFFTAFLLVVLCSIASLSLFAIQHNEIQENLPSESSGHCILFVSEKQVESNDIGGGGFCRFAIYGIGTIALCAVIYLLMYALKCVFGAELLTCLIIIEIPLLFCMAVVSLSHSLNTAIGLAFTCASYQDAGERGSCEDYSIPGESGTKFYDFILISEILSWAVTGTLMVLFVIYVILAVLFWRRGTRPKRSRPSKI